MSAALPVSVLIQAYRSSLITADQLRLDFAELARRTDIWINLALVERVAREIFGD